MFIGSINRHMRAVLQAAAEGWRGLPVYVACSGNFTVERIIARAGVGAIHANDVSIYSCALGWHLGGQEVRYGVRDERYAWLGEYLQPGVPTIATLLLAGEMLRVCGANAYGQRMAAEYRCRWPDLHAATAARVAKALAGLSVAGFFAGDCRDFLAKADTGGVCVSFPPTYKGGYERLYKKLDGLFDWPRPEYEVFAPGDFEAFSAQVRRFRHWMISSDREQPGLTDHHVATVQTSLRSKPVFMYADSPGPAGTHLATPRQNLGANPWPPRTDEVVQPVQIVPIDCKVMNTIRSQYLSAHIAVCDAPRNYAVLSAGRLIGAFSFALPRGPLPCDLYLLSDFAVRPSPHRRLSKLILACVVSKEVQADLEQWRCGRIKTIGTTAFTDKSVSMKYRGLFDVHSRSEGKVNYIGRAGRWPLKEAYQWWKDNHSTK